jgi:alpha-L-fucosidase
MINRRQFTGGLAAVACCTSAAIAKPIGIAGLPAALPTKQPMTELQRNFLNLRFGMYIHLNMATYEQREWGDPTASPQIFNPKNLDTDQWARAARSAGMTYGCLSTKHHDGFCIWPTSTTSPSVKDSAFKHDIVRSYVDSFRTHGLKVCLYFSILDLRANIRRYAVTKQKIELIKAQITELLTNYGEVTALIIDGWNASWSRLNYDQVPFLDIYDHVKSLQPNCLLTDYNAGEFPASVLYYTDIKQYEQHAGQTIPPGSIVPSQSATTLQSEWFWKQDYPSQELRSARQVVNEWLVPFNERNCNLILNVAPNPDGRFDQNAVNRLAEIGQLWKRPDPVQQLNPSVVITTKNLAFARPSFASSSADTSGPDLANDNNPRSYWTCDDGKDSGWLEVDLGGPTALNTVAVVEPVYLEQYGAESRIASYRVEAWTEGKWLEILSGELSKGQVHPVKENVAERVRLSIKGMGKSPGIAEFGVYAEPKRT